MSQQAAAGQEPGAAVAESHDSLPEAEGGG